MYFNTSNVTIQHTFIIAQATNDTNFNTSNVTIQLMTMRQKNKTSLFQYI